MGYQIKIDSRRINVTLVDLRYGRELNDKEAIEACRQVIALLTGQTPPQESDPFNPIKGW